MRNLPSSLLLLGSSIFGSLLSPCSAGAQPPPSTSTSRPTTSKPTPLKAAPRKVVLPRVLSSKRPAARSFYEGGVSAMAQGRFADARSMFRLAFALEEQSWILCNLAEAELGLGLPLSTLEKLERCVSAVAKDEKATGAERAAIEKLFDDARSRVLTVVIHGPESEDHATVIVTVDTERMFQTFPGRPDETLYFEPGKHVLTFSAAGHRSERIELEAEPGRRADLTPTLKRKAATEPTIAASPAPPPPSPGLVVPLFALAVAGLGTAGALRGARFVRRALDRYLTRG